MSARLAFAWPGLPDYAARCVRAVIDRHDGPVDVIATRPSVPIEGMERSLGQKVHWIAADAGDVPADVPLPDVLFCGGYATAPFNRLAWRVRAVGGRTILMSDNDWNGSVRQWLIEPIRHRLLLRHHFDGAFVPGASGERLARWWGYRPDAIERGMYGADPALFGPGPPPCARAREMLFVGQFIERKGVVPLARAFARFADAHPGWTLRLCGSGPLRTALPVHEAIVVADFVQPAALAPLLRAARVLVLPSREEHWGLVVHEAALSGCALALSDAVASGDDLADADNAVRFAANDEDALFTALCTLARWSPERWDAAGARSAAHAARFGPATFADAALRLAAPR